MKTVSVQITRDLDHRLRVWAAELDMSRADLIREALQEKLDRLDQADWAIGLRKSQTGDPDELRATGYISEC